MELMDRMVYMALGLLVGWLIGIYLTNKPKPQLVAVQPKPERDRGAARNVIDVYDDVREGIDKAVGE